MVGAKEGHGEDLWLNKSYLVFNHNKEVLLLSIEVCGLNQNNWMREQMMLTTGFQLAAARALLGMDQNQLAGLAGISANTVRNMEAAGAGPIAGRSVTVQSVQRALEQAGVEFLNHGQPGVRLARP
jgi:DNA-binding XRE family transcriptional regulator